jgi:DNA integrity scanning protein DisA with diadenylate cyclase activity
MSVWRNGRLQCKLPHLRTLSIAQTIQRTVIGLLVKSALEMMCKEVFIAWLQVLFRRLLRRTEENKEQPQSRYLVWRWIFEPSICRIQFRNPAYSPFHVTFIIQLAWRDWRQSWKIRLPHRQNMCETRYHVAKQCIALGDGHVVSRSLGARHLAAK